MVDVPKVAVNPSFVSSANALKAAKARREALRLESFGSNDKSLISKYRMAERDFHNAEAIFCSQKGLIGGGNLTEAQGMAQVDSIMNSVHSWYV